MKKLHILLDCDEVLNNLLEHWVNTLNKRHNTSAKAEDISIWDLRCVYPNLSNDEVLRPLWEDNFWRTLTPRPLSIEYAKRLIDDGHEVSVVTAQLAAYQTIPAKIDWLLKHYPFFKWDDVIITSKKQKVSGDVLIDDGIHNLEGGKYFKILFDCPNNRSYNAKQNGMTRVYSLKEAYEVIQENWRRIWQNCTSDTAQ